MPKTALITGCSLGFGLETTTALARRGWKVYASMRNMGRRDRLDAALKADDTGDRVTVIELDVTDTTSVKSAVAHVLAECSGALDAVVNNAGVSAGGTFEDLPDVELRRVMETNFFGVMNVTRATLPAMRERRSGCIVIVTSVGAFFGAPGLSAYSASKWALEGWAESLVLEVAPFGIDVACIEPGSYRTEIWDSSPRVLPPDGPYAELAAAAEKYTDEKVVPRARDPREVGEAIAKVLESPKPRFRTPVGPDAIVQHAARGKIPNRLMRLGVYRMLGLTGSGKPRSTS